MNIIKSNSIFNRMFLKLKGSWKYSHEFHNHERNYSRRWSIFYFSFQTNCVLISIIKPDINECVSNPCQNGGNCTDGVNGYTCTCELGYEGLSCETSMVLIYVQCFHWKYFNEYNFKNQCFYLNILYVEGFMKIFSRISSPQEILFLNSMFFLIFSQSNCVLHSIIKPYINECISNPCQNGGNCIDGVDGYTCTCELEYEGLSCETSMVLIYVQYFH